MPDCTRPTLSSCTRLYIRVFAQLQLFEITLLRYFQRPLFVSAHYWVEFGGGVLVRPLGREENNYWVLAIMLLLATDVSHHIVVSSAVIYQRIVLTCSISSVSLEGT